MVMLRMKSSFRANPLSFKLTSHVPGLSVVVTSNSIEFCVVIFKSGGCVEFSDII